MVWPPLLNSWLSHHTFHPTAIWRDFFFKHFSFKQGCICSTRLCEWKTEQRSSKRTCAWGVIGNFGCWRRWKTNPISTPSPPGQVEKTVPELYKAHAGKFFWNCSNRSKIVQMGSNLFQLVYMFFKFILVQIGLNLFKVNLSRLV